MVEGSGFGVWCRFSLRAGTLSALKSSFVSRFLRCCHYCCYQYSFQSFSRYVFAGVSSCIYFMVTCPWFWVCQSLFCSAFGFVLHSVLFGLGIGFVLLGVWGSTSGGFRWAVSPVCFKARYSTLRLPAPTCMVHDSDFKSFPRNMFWGPNACYLGTSLLLLPVHSPAA